MELVGLRTWTCSEGRAHVLGARTRGAGLEDRSGAPLLFWLDLLGLTCGLYYADVPPGLGPPLPAQIVTDP